jgi:cystine transport system substrate-binding protein
MQKGSTELKAAIDRAITEMRQQNLLDKWGQQYFGIERYSAQLIDHLP